MWSSILWKEKIAGCLRKCLLLFGHASAAGRGEDSQCQLHIREGQYKPCLVRHLLLTVEQRCTHAWPNTEEAYWGSRREEKAGREGISGPSCPRCGHEGQLCHRCQLPGDDRDLDLADSQGTSLPSSGSRANLLLDRVPRHSRLSSLNQGSCSFLQQQQKADRPRLCH